MIVQIEFIQLVGAVITLLGVLLAYGQILINALNKRLEERFEWIDRNRAEGQQNWAKTFQEHIEQERAEFESVRILEREFLNFRATLPLHYALREDMKHDLKRIETSIENVRGMIKDVLQAHHPDTKIIDAGASTGG